MPHRIAKSDEERWDRRNAKRAIANADADEYRRRRASKRCGRGERRFIAGIADGIMGEIMHAARRDLHRVILIRRERSRDDIRHLSRFLLRTFAIRSKNGVATDRHITRLHIETIDRLRKMR